MSTRVVHVLCAPFDVYIGRGRCPKTGKSSPWGNPFTHKDGTLAQFKVATIEEAVAEFRRWLPTRPDLMALLPTVKDKTLGCWCKRRGTEPCHGDVIAEFADALP